MQAALDGNALITYRFLSGNTNIWSDINAIVDAVPAETTLEVA